MALDWKKKSNQIICEETQTLDVLNKDFKSTILSIFEALRNPCLKN